MRIVLLLLCLFPVLTVAQTIKGSIVDSNGETLPNASIFIEETQFGTLANQEGIFEFTLKPGTYTINFQYIGYKKHQEHISIKENETKTLKISLVATAIKLGEVVINQQEDPALSIMRKTIALSNFHHNEIQNFSVRSYSKSNFKVFDIPFLLNKAFEDSNIQKNALYVMEGISEFSYTKPNKITEKIIAIKSTLPKNMANNVDMYNYFTDLFDPTDGESPVTRKGARNYTYSYLGYFEENGQIINKIKVIPKSSGYYSGTLNIVDGSWYIHSATLTQKESGATSTYNLLYKKTNDLWFLNYREIKAKINFLGIKANVNSITSYKNLSLKKDPKFATIKPEIIDEKLFKEEGVRLQKNLNEKALEEIITSEKITLKHLKKIERKFEKEEYKKAEKDTSYFNNRKHTVDSTSKSKNKEFWEAERMVPLTKNEIEGEKTTDSLHFIIKDKIASQIKKDSISKKNVNKFTLNHLIMGNRYKFGDKLTDHPYGPQKHEIYYNGLANSLAYNSVSGVEVGFLNTKYTYRKTPKIAYNIGINPSYSFGRNKFYGEANAGFSNPKLSLNVKAFNQINQLNLNKPYSNYNIAYNILLNNENYGVFILNKGYQVDLTKQFNSKISASLSYNTTQRTSVENSINKGLFYKNTENFTPNIAVHSSGITSDLTQNTLRKIEATINYSPWLWKANIRKGSYYWGPQFALKNTVAFGANGFNKIELKVKYDFKIRNINFNYWGETGAFYKRYPTYLVDYHHFLSNELIGTKPGKIRDLDPYLNSSNENYLTSVLQITPKRFLLSRIDFLNNKTVKDYMVITAIKSPYITKQEIGYGVSILDQQLRAEVLKEPNRKGLIFKIMTLIKL